MNNKPQQIHIRCAVHWEIGGPQNLEEPASNEALRELCDNNYHQRLPLIAEKMQKEKEQQDKLKAVKARLLYGNESGRNPRNHEESHYSESKTPTARKSPGEGWGAALRSPSPVGQEEKNHARIHALIVTTRVPKQGEPRYRQESIIMRARRPEEPADIRRAKTVKGVTGSPNRKGTGQIPTKTISPNLGRVKKEILSRPEYNTSTVPRTKDCPAMVKTYDGCGIQRPYKLISVPLQNREMGNANIGAHVQLYANWENYHQQTKHIKDPVEIHHIKQRDGESTEDFMERYKEEVLDVEGAPKCMKISGFMHGITHPELIKREVAAFSHGRKKAPTTWKQPEGGNKPSFKKGFKNKHRSDRKPDRFSLLTKTPKEIFALEKGKFKAPPPMVTPAEKRDPNKYCEFHADTGHSTDECMQLRKQIDEMIKAGKLSQFIKELKQNDKPKAPKKGDTTGKERPLAILMIQPWEKTRRIGGTKIIEAEMEGTSWHRIARFLASENRDEGHSTSHGWNFMVVRGTIHLGLPEQTIAIGSTLTEKGRKELCTLLGQNLNVFAWKPTDMTGVSRSIAEHYLNIREGCPPVKQKKRGQAPERNKAIQEEVGKLVDAGIMREVHYHSWLSNSVMVKKHDGIPGE
ncbi:hypothetical protein Tco_1176592 [Tanacetum coccineum]